MNGFILFLGIVQLLAGLVVVGLVAKTFHDELNSAQADTEAKAYAFGPVLVGLLVAFGGVCAILAKCCLSTGTYIIYLIFTTVAASASVALVWYYGFNYYSIHQLCGGALKALTCVYSDETINITITLLAFSGLCCLASLIGIITAGCYIYRRTPSSISY